MNFSIEQNTAFDGWKQSHAIEEFCLTSSGEEGICMKILILKNV